MADTTIMPIFAIPWNAVSCPLFPISILSLQLTSLVLACLLDDDHKPASRVVVTSRTVRAHAPSQESDPNENCSASSCWTWAG